MVGYVWPIVATGADRLLRLEFDYRLEMWPSQIMAYLWVIDNNEVLSKS